jgi:hypothetical protein
MIIFSNGCSHTRGACRDSVDDSYATLLATSIFGKNNFEILKPEILENTLFSFEHTISLIEEGKNYLIFESDYGKPNELIFYETYHFINECIVQNIKVDYCFIQTSGTNRRLHFNEKDIKIYVNPHDNYELGLKPEPFGTHSTLQYIKILQDLFVSNNIEYVFIPYMELDKHSFKSFKYKNLIDLTKFTVHPIEGHRNNFRMNNLVCDEPGHPNLLGNYKLHDMISEILGIENNIGFYDYFLNSEHGVSPYLGTPQNNNDIKNTSTILGDGTIDEIKEALKKIKKKLF